jgi:hypothetical protein
VAQCRQGYNLLDRKTETDTDTDEEPEKTHQETPPRWPSSRRLWTGSQESYRSCPWDQNSGGAGTTTAMAEYQMHASISLAKAAEGTCRWTEKKAENRSPGLVQFRKESPGLRSLPFSHDFAEFCNGLL